MYHGREKVTEKDRERASAEQGDESGESEMRKRERHCRAQTVNLTWISVREKE